MEEARTSDGRLVAFNVNGTGIVFHGRREVAPDKSFVATRWLALFYFPIFPLGSYRIWPLKEQSPPPFLFKQGTFAWQRVRLRWTQILGTYLVAFLAVGFLVTFTLWIATKGTFQLPGW